MFDKLAIHGGNPTVTSRFEPFNTFDHQEKEAVLRVLDSGVLSGFVGAWGDQFNGGKEVKEFERQCEAYFDVAHAITVNSWTSGLICSVGALDIEPGDEIIVSTWTMCASASAILVWNAIPVFADIEKDTFNMDPASVERLITAKTKAILIPHIFGHPAKMSELCALAKKHNLKIIEDAAQSPGAMYDNQKVGAIGDIGGFSLNYHKHIHTGEGGIIVTNNDTLAERARLIRNHAEAVVVHRPEIQLNNMLGFNFRLGEIEAAIGQAQLTKLDNVLSIRRLEAEKILAGLSELKGLNIPTTLSQCTHDYYILGMHLSPELHHIGNKKIVAALRAEGIPGVADSYVTLHRYPMYKNKIAYGTQGFPFTLASTTALNSYQPGSCPTAEELDDCSYVGLAVCLYHYSEKNIEQIVAAFQKVWNNIEALA